MSHRTRAGAAVALSALVVLAAGALVVCGRKSSEPREARPRAPEALAFAVIDSLLGPRVAVAEIGVSLRPPRGFRSVSDSVVVSLGGSGLASIPERLPPDAHQRPGARLVAAFVDGSRQAGLAVFVREGLARDDEGFAAWYEDALRRANPGAEVRRGEYVVNDVYVRNILVSDEVSVRFHLLCFAESGEPAELLYFADRVSYPDLVRSFESSIGTVKGTGEGG